MNSLEVLMETITVQEHQQPVTTQQTENEWEDKLVYNFGDQYSPRQYNIEDLTSSGQFNWDPFENQNETRTNIDDIDRMQSLIEQMNYLENSIDTTGNSLDLEFLAITADLNSLHGSIPIGASPEEPQANANLLCAQQILAGQSALLENSNRSRVQHINSVVPANVEYQPSFDGCKPYSQTVKLELESSEFDSILAFDFDNLKKIEVKCQPREKFRPRTQNESRTSSHYIRCKEGVRPEYPTILLKPEWLHESSNNIIEVCLVGLDKQPHPYALENKQSTIGYQKESSIFKQQENNTIYFIITEEDFQNGQKTFLVEYVKARQDHVITKEYIRERKLDQSMLRFTRFYESANGEFIKDAESETFSTVMAEAYGDIEVEHMGPRMGPMLGEEMIYGVLKGRVLKNELTIEITEETSGWNHQITNFTKNGNVVYFKMPPFPYPEMVRVTANIAVYCRGTELFRMPYLIQGSFDDELRALSLNDSSINLPVSSVHAQFNPINFLSTVVPMSSSSSKKSTSKRVKRLSGK